MLIHLFDREFRKAKRKYNREIQCNIENLNSKRPTEFWEEVNKLGLTKKDNIPLQVCNEQNEIINDIPSVLGKRENVFKVLYNFQSKDAGFNETFYNDILLRKQNLENRVSGTNVLNKEFTNIEITKVLTKSKLKKAVGPDNLPNEVLKWPQSVSLLTNFFNGILQTGFTAKIWRQAIIKPIPKSSMTDLRTPEQYRGISLLSTISKLFTIIINNRLTRYLEDNNLYADEQNGFRGVGNCIDHIFSLTSIIKNRKNRGLSTYIYSLYRCRVDRELLLYKLLNIGIGGRMYDIIKNIYIQEQLRV